MNHYTEFELFTQRVYQKLVNNDFSSQQLCSTT